jgi:hypothetical protein
VSWAHKRGLQCPAGIRAVVSVLLVWQLVTCLIILVDTAAVLRGLEGPYQPRACINKPDAIILDWCVSFGVASEWGLGVWLGIGRGREWVWFLAAGTELLGWHTVHLGRCWTQALAAVACAGGSLPVPVMLLRLLVAPPAEALSTPMLHRLWSVMCPDPSHGKQRAVTAGPCMGLLLVCLDADACQCGLSCDTCPAVSGGVVCQAACGFAQCCSTKSSLGRQQMSVHTSCPRLCSACTLPLRSAQDTGKCMPSPAASCAGLKHAGAGVVTVGLQQLPLVSSWGAVGQVVVHSVGMQ